MHLFWRGWPPDARAVAVTLEIPTAPVVRELYFFALQASFSGPGGRRFGAGHLGLQWYSPHPGNTAVNWGGYGADGRELPGSESELPSATWNPNTRDYAWSAGTSYRLRIARGEHGWTGEVRDLASGELTVVRELAAGGDTLVDPMVWCEVFAPCDAPTVTTRWTDLTVETDAGDVVITDVATNYQSLADGGCTNTASRPTADGAWLQQTNVDRA
jgi:hypothetical protein